ncbi:nucleotide sugar dehydrogenase [Lactobacillus sp. YT155]|uniref:nucleotide sugar dehydrogenase n=1 Tax=Lactobacillus sp. YT155 TaxID=3060955 RepID=UPI00265F90F8|nr:nucleotide sugar dehydrogenase [Lactobacillus sp. YT155]MDO1605241.1 nucleotide sugar dehydrogenase [Lactobacillus sp. YT155]
MNITVVGTGYVGLSLAALLSQKNQVVAFDINKEKIDLINQGKSPIVDKEISSFLAEKDLNLTATSSVSNVYQDSDFVIIATPTNYNPQKNYFDTSSVESVIEDVQAQNSNATIIIKSTIPVGFTKKVREQYKTNNIIFSPEFLREGKALYDNLHPSRIIVGDTTEPAKEFAGLLSDASLEENTPVLFVESTEAESIKLFSNTYLAMRVAYFNELDTYAEVKNLSSKNIIEGVSMDPRIGNFYNNPSFGYGGYCLPKDSKQLLANYQGVPNDLITAIVNSNLTRKNFIANQIISDRPKKVGIYKLAMKEGSDNFRESSIQDVMESIRERGIDVVIYEPTIQEDSYFDYQVEHDFDKFVDESDVIVANRIDQNLEKLDHSYKIYTRDIFHIG